jgi:hypothetical protein
MAANREAAERNIRAAIGNRRETFMLVSLTLTGDGYRVTCSHGPLTVRKIIDEGIAEDVAPAGEPATKALAAVLEEVRSEFSGPGRGRR